MKRLLIFLLITAFIFSGCNYNIETAYQSDYDFEVHFIDVGQADAALVFSNGKTMLIDGGNVADSSLVYSYLKKYSVDILDYVVATHPHEDHIGGLPGAFRYADVGKVLAPTAEADSKCYRDLVSAVREQGLDIYNPIHGESFEFGGSIVEVLGPVNEAPENANDSSIVLKITYQDISVLFTGDAEYESEHLMLNEGYDLESTVLKAPHHGSDSSSSYSFLRAVNPEYIVISVGDGNSYGHPHDSVLSRYSALGSKVFRTDINGTVILKSDGYDVKFSSERGNSSTDKNEVGDYIGNKNSKVYHHPSCDALPKEKNRVFFEDLSEAEKEGYIPCGNCIN